MDRPFLPTRVRCAAAAWLLAAAALGAVDALIAIGHSAGVAPERTLPLCLTAPFTMALLVLVPATVLSTMRAAWPGARTTFRSQLSFLVGIAGSLTALRAASMITTQAVSPRPLGRVGVIAGCVAVAAIGLVGFGIGQRLAVTWLRRTSRARLPWLVGMAAILHAAAFGGVVWQWCREGRGLERDLLGAAREAWSAEAEAMRPRVGEAADGTTAHMLSVPDNLVLVTIDTLRADHLDDARMPRTAALAHDGVRFTQAFASSSWTLPSVASLLTGLPAGRHGAGAPRGLDPLSRAPLDTMHATLATVLGRAGFATRAIVTNPYLGLGYGLGQGFDAYENVASRARWRSRSVRPWASRRSPGSCRGWRSRIAATR